jgi:hypothetical protein
MRNARGQPLRCRNEKEKKARFFLHALFRPDSILKSIRVSRIISVAVRMNLESRWQWRQCCAGVVFTLAAGVLLAPATARAGCGDYVTFGSGRHIDQSSDKTAPAAQNGASSTGFLRDRPCQPCRHAPATPDHGPVPCTGPNCSGSPPVLPLASGPVKTHHERDWACTALVPIEANPTFYTSPLNSASLPIERQGAEVYHPPR